MLTVIPFYSGDKDQAIRLLTWIRDIGQVKHHDCLIVVDRGTNSKGVIEIARDCFKEVHEAPSEVVGQQGEWGHGTTDATAPNEMFLTAYVYIQHKLKRPFFWAEPDIAPIPLPFGRVWLNEIEAEHIKGRKPFMGALVSVPPHEPHMSGIGVYPACIPDHSMDMAIPGKIAWDYAGRRDTVGRGRAHFTNLIQHEYRTDGKSPTFPDQSSLAQIRPETVVFHRCKDNSLIDRLREKFSNQPIPVKVRASSVEAENERLRREMDEMKKRLDQLTSPSKSSPEPRKQGVPMKKKRTLSPEHLAKLCAGRAKSREKASK